MSRNKEGQRSVKISLRMKLSLMEVLVMMIILIANLLLVLMINRSIHTIGTVYSSNVTLNEMSTTLNQVESSLTEYLNTKSTESAENYYRYEQDLRKSQSTLNDKVSADPVLIAEKNIRNLTDTYLSYTDEAIEAKRGRNIEKYKVSYEKSEQILSYVNESISALNNERFRENVKTYEELTGSLHSLELLCFSILILAAVVGVVMVFITSAAITTPLKNLADAASEVSQGNYDVELPENPPQDEVGVLTEAFRKMVLSIQENMVRIRENMETEQNLKEKQLLMETHLKDARLKYLQAQINPHFLFNTLNAGAQLAMMEGADRAYEYIRRVASFYRYNIGKDNGVVTLRDEIDLVDTYVYILNVRFSGEIGYEKEIDETLLDLNVPGMILQPIVENAVKYGIRNLPRDGVITLSVYREEGHAVVSIKDNGAGMTAERIQEVMEHKVVRSDSESDLNGVGLDNVRGRLELYYSEENILTIFSLGEGMGTEVVLTLPMEKENDQDPAC